tara:strand:+ start:3885 stop:4643 length:759 start_codon:yes stop_codon:yes gene_type:complete
MEEILPKRRGRKKLTEVNVEKQETEGITEKKKRGRKKKWETTTFKTNYLIENNIDPIIFDKKEIDDNYKTQNFTFGNLCIEVHDKEQDDKNLDIFKTTNKECEINISSDEEDTCDTKKLFYTKKLHIVKNDKIDVKNNIRCYNCHYPFNNIPFYLPIDYCQKLDRYKLFGNFCSPNCVKSYCLNNKIFENKSYLVGQFYRKLFGASFRINPAPSIFCLEDYGGDMTIEEYRKFNYKNNRYTMSNINSKVITF